MTTRRPTTKEPATTEWLLLIHQLPPTPAYLRAKIGRHLARVGAVALKNSVYVLPSTEQAREDLAWVRREITSGGGEGWVCAASFVDGLTGAEVERLFQTARDADYRALSDEARELRRALPRRGALPEERRQTLDADLARLRKRLSDTIAVDFFDAPGRAPIEGLIAELAARLSDGPEPPARSPPEIAIAEMRGRTWVTRRNVHIDRIASAWLVRRLIDPEAQFKFVVGKEYHPGAGELRFDMFEAEITHEGDRCTFEVLLARLGVRDPALGAIGEIVHDIDLKDEKFGRPERAGVERMMLGIIAAEPDDEARIEKATPLLDSLCASFAEPAGRAEPAASLATGRGRHRRERPPTAR